MPGSGGLMIKQWAVGHVAIDQINVFDNTFFNIIDCRLVVIYSISPALSFD